MARVGVAAHREAIGRIDTFLTSVAFDGGRWVRRRSWRMGRAIETGAQVVHERFLRYVRKRGWIATDAAVVLAAQRMESKAVPPYPGFSIRSKKVAPNADAINAGKYILEDGTSGRLDELSFLRDPFAKGSSLARLRFYSLEWVDDLLDAYRLSGKPAYLEGAHSLTARWIGECLDSERSPDVWSDHATALRAIVLCRVWDAFRTREAAGSPFIHGLMAAIVRHGEKLAHSRLYRPEHNHGVTQAYGLLAIGLLFPVLPDGSRWADLGRSRLEEQMAHNVSPEGVHREHSPYYHFYVFRHFAYARELAAKYGMKFTRTFEERLEAMLTAGAQLIKPNGMLAALGDTSRVSPILVHPSELWEGRDCRGRPGVPGGRGEEAPRGESQSTLMAGAGYAVLRTGLCDAEPPEDERHVVMRLSTFQAAHIHRDVFSFEFYGYGDDLVIDSGGPFRYADRLRTAYFLSTRAHNTVVVDDRDQAVGESRLLHWQPGIAFDALLAEHHNYPDVTHRRALILVRPRYLIVVDRLEAARVHDYCQYFHFNPALTAALHGIDASTIHTREGPTVRVVALLSVGLQAQTLHGAMEPYQGWVCLREGEMIPHDVVKYRRRAQRATFAVLLLAEPPAASSQVSVSLEGIPLERHATFRVTLDGVEDEIAMAPTGTVTFGRKGCHDAA